MSLTPLPAPFPATPPEKRPRRDTARLPPLQAQTRLATPLGPLLAAASAQGLAGLWFDGQAHHPGALEAPEDGRHPHLQAAAQALAGYFGGQPWARLIEGLPLDLLGTPFQRAVWAALLTIPSGQTRSYGQIAAAVGSPAAVRAVGAAVGRNPVTVLVPCHRVLGSGGQLTGYAGGLDRKTALLAHEQAMAPADRFTLGAGPVQVELLPGCAQPARPAGGHWPA